MFLRLGQALGKARKQRRNVCKAFFGRTPENGNADLLSPHRGHIGLCIVVPINLDTIAPGLQPEMLA
jgi:hypothetical protein